MAGKSHKDLKLVQRSLKKSAENLHDLQIRIEDLGAQIALSKAAAQKHPPSRQQRKSSRA